MTTSKRLWIQKREPPGSLSSICHPILDIKSEQGWIVQLTKILVTKKLEGLAAPQAGINKQVFITDVAGDHIRIFINPVLTITNYEQSSVREACYTYPRTNKARQRHRHVLVDAMNYSGERFILDTCDSKYTEEVSWLLSARIQHEMEHMLGLPVRIEPDIVTGQTALADLVHYSRGPSALAQ